MLTDLTNNHHTNIIFILIAIFHTNWASPDPLGFFQFYWKRTSRLCDTGFHGPDVPPDNQLTDWKHQKLEALTNHRNHSLDWSFLQPPMDSLREINSTTYPGTCHLCDQTAFDHVSWKYKGWWAKHPTTWLIVSRQNRYITWDTWMKLVLIGNTKAGK